MSVNYTNAIYLQIIVCFLQITGGKFNHSTIIRFVSSPAEFRIVQRFYGLNVWDQLSVEVEVFGTLPEIPIGGSLAIPDRTDEYSYTSDTSMRSVGRVRVTLDEQQFAYDIDQQVII